MRYYWRELKRLTESIFSELMSHPTEERYLEFKRSVHWGDAVSAKITKSILAMANLRDGGWIVLGKEEKDDRTFMPVGMSQSDFDSFDPDEIKTFVNGYADPYVVFFIYKTEHESKRFILIRVEEFDTVPVICKRDWGDVLHRGQIYVRSRAKPESVPVPSQSEMREIVDIAIDKGVKLLFQRISRAGIALPVPSDIELFDKQLEKLR